MGPWSGERAWWWGSALWEDTGEMISLPPPRRSKEGAAACEPEAGPRRRWIRLLPGSGRFRHHAALEQPLPEPRASWRQTSPRPALPGKLVTRIFLQATSLLGNPLGGLSACLHKHELSPGIWCHIRNYSPLQSWQWRAVATCWGPHPDTPLLVFPGPGLPSPAQRLTRRLREATWG